MYEFLEKSEKKFFPPISESFKKFGLTLDQYAEKLSQKLTSVS
jgi:hypothetical protein